MTDMQTKVVPLDDLVDHPANADEREMTRSAFEALGFSFKTFGYVEPIVWNQRTGFIVGGHQRKRVLLEQGATEATVVVVDLDPVDEDALRVHLNNPGSQGRYRDGVNAYLDRIEDERAELFRDLELDKARQKQPKKIKASEVAVGDVADEFVLTVTGPLPAQADVLDELRAALVAIDGDCDVNIIVSKIEP